MMHKPVVRIVHWKEKHNLVPRGGIDQ